MSTKQKSGNRNELIRCKNCGEDYSVTYKRCPFCDESAARNASGRGGRRLNNTKGGGYGGGWSLARIITTALSVALIVAAIGIVVTIVKPLIDRGSSEPGTVITESPAADTSAPDQTAEPDPEESAVVQTAESFTLNAEDITLRTPGETYQLKAGFAPEGTTGNITWTSSDPTIVAVAADGTVTALANGNSTITAAMDDGYTQTCVVRCSWSGGATAAPTALTLNRTDITLRSRGETFTLKVSGTDSTPVWSIGDASVATISGSGTVTAVKSGMTTVTVKVDGQTLKCIVRCTF